MPWFFQGYGLVSEVFLHACSPSSIFLNFLVLLQLCHGGCLKIGERLFPYLGAATHKGKLDRIGFSM